MLTVTDGMIQHPNIVPKRYTNLERGDMKEVNGIILHQTSSSQSFTTLMAYMWRDVGAHFLIAPDGTIYQTARIDKVCFHVGMIKAVCIETHSCAADDKKAIDQLWNPKLSAEENRMALHKYESKKPAAARFPTNLDSIGIEVVGAMEGKSYAKPSDAQNKSAKWLVRELLETVKVDRKRVYKHGQVSYKESSEAGKVEY